MKAKAEKKCPNCDGSGKVVTGDSLRKTVSTCSKCSGTGRVKKYQ